MEKTYKAVQKYIRMSPSKIRVVVNAINKLTPKEALEILPHVNKRAAEPVRKVIKSAVANAGVQGVGEETLVFTEIQVNEAVRMKRGRAAGRGRWHGYKKRMSHIRVVLGVKGEEKTEEKNVKETSGKTIKTKKIVSKVFKKKGEKK